MISNNHLIVHRKKGLENVCSRAFFFFVSIFLNSALHAPHTEDARGLAEFEELKQTPTLGGNSISHPSVGVFPFIRTDKFQIFDQRIDGVVRNLELRIAALHSLSRRHHDHAQSGSQRSHKYLALQRSSSDTQSISIHPIFKLIEILLNQPSGSSRATSTWEH